MKNNRSYCLMNATAVHSLHLYFKEIIKELADGVRPATPQQVERYEKIKQIINCLRNEGDAIIDEVDMVLDCLKEVTFSSGSRSPVSDEIQENLKNIFISLKGDKNLNDFFKIERETEQRFDVKKYEEEIKPVLAQMLLKLANCENLKEKDKQELLKFLLRDPSLKTIPNPINDEKIGTLWRLGGSSFTIYSLSLSRKIAMYILVYRRHIP